VNYAFAIDAPFPASDILP